MGWQRPRVCYPLNTTAQSRKLGLEYAFTPLQRPAERVLAAFAYRTPMFRGWLYLALIAAVLLVAGRGPGRTPLLVLGASGLLYGLAYFVVSTECAFRMNWWFIVAALVSVIVALGLTNKADQFARNASSTALGSTRRTPQSDAGSRDASTHRS